VIILYQGDPVSLHITIQGTFGNIHNLVNLVGGKHSNLLLLMGENPGDILMLYDHSLTSGTSDAIKGQTTVQSHVMGDFATILNTAEFHPASHPDSIQIKTLNLLAFKVPRHRRSPVLIGAL
jgi:hypothetical protein